MDDFYAIYDAVYVNDEGNLEPDGIKNNQNSIYLSKMITRLTKVKRDRFTLG
jgi:hypothetical protein